MKAVCIMGSPRENGCTSYLVDRMIEGLESAGVEVRRYSLGKLNIRYCQGCMICTKTKMCIQKDDMIRIHQAMMESDIIVVASPSYWGDLTGQLKVLIDRCLPLVNVETHASQLPPDKVGVAVAIRAGQEEAENLHLISTIEHFFDHLGIRPVRRLTVEGVQTLRDMEGKTAKIEEAIRIGHEVGAGGRLI